MTEVHIAKERFEQFVQEKLKDAWPDSQWAFYTALLETAKRLKIDYSGYISAAQQDDRAQAKTRNQAEQEAARNTFQLPPRKSRGLGR